MMAMSRMTLGAVGQLGRTAVGMMGIVVVVAAIVPTPTSGPEARSRSGPGDAEGPADVVALTMPEGALSKSLTITDPSGRELATLTYFRADFTHLVARCGGADLSCSVYPRKDRITCELTGTVRRTRIEMDPDGRTSSLLMPSPRRRLEEHADDELPPEKGTEIPVFLPLSPARFAF